MAKPLGQATNQVQEQWSFSGAAFAVSLRQSICSWAEYSFGTANAVEVRTSFREG
jgi:hypothetical protein